VGRPVQSSPTPSKTLRRLPSTPSCCSPSSSPPPATSLAGIDGQRCPPRSDSGQGLHCKHSNSSRVLYAKFQSLPLFQIREVQKCVGIHRKSRKIPNLLG
jgi:hypothetical protein